ncbi:MAG: hypothetical protein JWO19_4436 [Bryobacterales bacterium]|nr:hypothetical protein [Bryobacterales bacterium]
METVNNPIVTEWLSLAQLRALLLTGGIEISTPGGTLRLYVNFIDRVSAQELAKK